MENQQFDDAFGQALMAFYQGDVSTHSVERDDGYLEVAETGVYFDASDLKFGYDAQALSAIPKGSRVLDIGCGAGRHCLFLQDRGALPTGIDSSPLALEVCRLRGVQDVRQIAIEQMAEKLTGEKFDFITMLGHNFGLFGDFEKAKKLLGDLDVLTHSQAKIIATTRVPGLTSNPVHLAYHELNRKRGRPIGQLTLRTRFENLAGPWHDYLFVSPEELEVILSGTAWQVEKLIQSPKVGHASYVMVLAKR
jgi:SAM-dependent methyltransferase